MSSNQADAKSNSSRQIAAVLLIDTDEHGEKVHHALEQSGLTVFRVKDDSAALEAVRKTSPDVILGNWDEEKLDVTSVVNKLRSRRPSLQAVPTMLMTEMKIDTSIAFALNNAGFDIIVQKPVDEKTLAPLVLKTARKKRSWRRSSVSFRLQGDALAASASGCLFKGI
jgi:response regulator RpfG family c-di-GMP phosphodiesterase